EVIESDEGDDDATESDGESEEEETKEQEEESFYLIPRTPEDSEDDGNNEDDQGLRICKEERISEEEEADELYGDVDINQGRGLQVWSPFFTTGSSTVTPIPSPQSTMTPSIISTSMTASQLPIPPTPIPSLYLQNLPTFASVFRFEDRVKTLEVYFSNISSMESIFTTGSSTVTPIPSPKSTMNTSIITTTTTGSQPPIPPTPIPNRLQDSIQRENDEFLRTIDDNMKKIIKEQVKSQVKVQVTRMLPRIEESVNAQLKAKVLTRSSHSSRTSYAVAVDLDEEKGGSIHQPALHPNQLPGVQAGLLQGLNLDSCLPVSLLLQRNLCRLPVRWRNPHIWCLKQ
nr:hypothetical protein [Tanacetum cinerariifolium]